MSKMKSKKVQQTDAILKVLTIGDSGVGKTNMITRYCQHKFSDSYVATIGIDFKVKKIKLDNYSLRLQIWDTAGQQRFRNITNTFYKGAAGILIVFSITDIQSFNNVANWIRQINNNTQENVTKILVGTKIDLQPQRKINKNQAQAFAKKYHMKYVQVSAKTGINIDECFNTLISQIRQKYDQLDQPLVSSKGVHIKTHLKIDDGRKCAC